MGYLDMQPSKRTVTVSGTKYLDPTGSLHAIMFGPNGPPQGSALSQLLSQYQKETTSPVTQNYSYNSITPNNSSPPAQNQASIPSEMQNDYQNYWATSQPGSTMEWGGGTLQRGQTGAIYTDPSGVTTLLTPGSDLNQLAFQNPYIAQQWGMQYGFQPTQEPAIDLPIGQDAANQSTSTTGMDWNSPVGKTILPYLQQAISGLTDRTNQLPGMLQSLYGGLMRNALGPQAFQGTLNQLGSRNILNSSVASNAMADVASNIAKNIGQAGYNSALAGLQQQLALPGNLANLANTVAGKTAGSTYLDPLAPYKLFASMMG